MKALYFLILKCVVLNSNNNNNKNHSQTVNFSDYALESQSLALLFSIHSKFCVSVRACAHTYKMEKPLRPERTNKRTSREEERTKLCTETWGRRRRKAAKQCARQHSKTAKKGKKRNKEWCILCVATEIYGKSVCMLEQQRQQQQLTETVHR